MTFGQILCTAFLARLCRPATRPQRKLVKSEIMIERTIAPLAVFQVTLGERRGRVTKTALVTLARLPDHLRDVRS
jgi:hypothetical protein